MNKQLLDIEPKELKFAFILKKQCSCSVTLTNNTNQYVAFKVKTTSPKKYCVRPNVAIIMPKSVFDFTVTMQAQREAPPDMICKDKFLIQSTVVPVGTSDEDITSATFVMDGGRYVEENKLKVSLVSPPHSPLLSPINGTTNLEIDYDASIPKSQYSAELGFLDHCRREAYAYTFKENIMLSSLYQVAEVEESKIVTFEDLKPKKDVEWNPRRDMFHEEALKPLQTVIDVEEPKIVTFEDLKPKKDVEWKPRKDMFHEEDLKPKNDAEPKPRNDVKDEALNLEKDTELNPKNNVVNGMELKPVKDVESKPMDGILDTKELKSVKEKEFSVLKDGKVSTWKTAEELKFSKDMEEMKSKLNDLETKLGKAEVTISKLAEKRRVCSQERKILQEELALLRKTANLRRVRVGFSLLFVCMVALVSVFLGYLLHD